MAQTEILEIGSIKYPLKIHVERRDNSYVSIGRRSINIHVPLSLPRDKQFLEIHRLKTWAKQKIMENPEKHKAKEPKLYTDDQQIRIGKETYTLQISYKDKASSSGRIDKDKIHLDISSTLNEEMRSRHISTLLSRCIARKRIPLLQKRISELNELHFGGKVGKIFFKHQKRSWGSCSRAGNINISTRLLFAPDDVLDYVCVHELAHLTEMNHSDKFWALVKNAMPDYDVKERWLKENGKSCEF